MAKSLVIVESPAKAKTINKMLGAEYVVKSSVGHVRDLPVKELGVDVENEFEPKYEVIKGKKKVITEIKAAAKSAEKIFLAPDPDREGEAIAWHIASEISKNGEIYRVTFNEITKDAVIRAFHDPGKIDMDKVNAQQARRILDRLVGYKISPLLWRRVKTGLSAGRVQSVALRIICEREREIQAFEPQEYWSIIAHLRGSQQPDFDAKLIKIGSKKFETSHGDEARDHVEEIKKNEFVVSGISEKKRLRRPVPPFITSTLQQEASRCYYFSSKKTMAVAQGLYEGISLGERGTMGLITYMRTDSVRIAREALSDARKFIKQNYGPGYLPEHAQHYKSAKAAQEAHEAIRPTMPHLTPESAKQHLTPDQFKLYDLIWKRFMASQMKPALYNTVQVDINAGQYLFRAVGSTLLFDGFLKVYEEKTDAEEENGNGTVKLSQKEPLLPQLKKSEILKLLKLTPNQHFTKPPPRYTEATLVKELEKQGIGRPSTYAMIMSRIQDKNYTIKEKRQFVPTELGFLITDMLVENFADILEVKFTAALEDKLDQIESGKADWIDILKQFYKPFSADLEKAEKEMRPKSEPTGIKCEQCGGEMLKRWGKNGFFLGCSGYPKCKNTKSLDEQNGETKAEPVETGEVCDKCGGNMVLRNGRYGEFLACGNYPKCKNIKSLKKGADTNAGAGSETEMEDKCEKCGAPLVEKYGRYGKFLACSAYPECKYIKRNRTSTDVACPRKDCDGVLSARMTKKRKRFYSCSNYPKCDYAVWNLDDVGKDEAGETA